MAAKAYMDIISTGPIAINLGTLSTHAENSMRLLYKPTIVTPIRLIIILVT